MSYKPVLALLFIFTLVLLPSISAWEFDNVKSYDAIAKEVTISNSVLGIPFLPTGEIARIKLLTPLENKVGAGYQKVAEFQVNSFVDYPTAIKQLELYNVKDGMKAISRQIDYKYKTTEEVEITDYKDECSPAKLNETELMNGTKPYDVCVQVKGGSHFETQEVWKDLSSMDMKAEILTIGLFTDVQVGDKVEWIPNLYGIRVEEWASWSADLNVGLVSYYKLDEGTGNALDSLKLYNLTQTGVIGNVSGKINNSRGDWGSGSGKIFSTTSYQTIGLNKPLTLSAWAKKTTVATTENGHILAVGCGENGNFKTAIFQNSTDDTIAATIHKSHVGSVDSTGYAISPDTWYYFTLVYLGNGTAKFYVNSNYYSSVTYSNGQTDNACASIGQGMYNSGGDNGEFDNGYVDEAGIWNRTLTQAEITQLYNSGAGMTYLNSFGPNITINTASQNFTEVASRQFNFTVFDSIKVKNVSLYINGKINQTNTSGLNNTRYLFNVTLGDGTYTILGNAWNNQTSNNVANSSAITIIVESTHPIITANLSNSTLYVLGGNLTLNYNVTHDPNLTGVTAWYSYNGTNRTLNTSLSSINFTTTLNQYNLTLYANDTLGNLATPVSLSFSLDSVYPQITLNYPTALINYGAINGTLQLNFTATDTNLDKVWYNYNGTNVSIAGALSGIANLSNITLTSKKNITIYANDTAGNLNTSVFSWDYNFFENNRTYNTITYETSNENFSLNFNAANTVLSGNAIFNYNGTSYTSVFSCNGLNCNVNSNLDIPLLSGASAQNKSFYWQITTFSGNGSNIFNTTTYTQLVNPLTLTACTGTNVSMNFTAYDEQTRSRLNPFDFQGNFEYYTGLGAIHKDLIVSNTSTPYIALCLNVNTTYYIDSTITYAAPAYTTQGSSTTIGNATQSTTTVNTSFNYPTRTYYYQTYPISLTTKNVSLLLLGSPSSTNFLLNVLDSALRPVNNVLVEAQRCYAGLNTTNNNNNITAFISKTDISGYTSGNLEIYTGQYQFFITNHSNTLLAVTPCTAISPQSTPYTLTFKLGQAYQSPFTNVENLTDINGSLIYNYTSKQVVMTYVDTSGVFVKAQLLVKLANATGSTQTIICDTNSTLSSGIITCNIAAGGSYTATAYIYRTNRILVDQITFLYETASSTLGYYGVFLGMLLLIIGAFAFKFNELAGIWLEFAIIVFCNAVGLIAFGNVFITAYFCLGLIISGVLER